MDNRTSGYFSKNPGKYLEIHKEAKLGVVITRKGPDTSSLLFSSKMFRADSISDKIMRVLRNNSSPCNVSVHNSCRRLNKSVLRSCSKVEINFSALSAEILSSSAPFGTEL